MGINITWKISLCLTLISLTKLAALKKKKKNTKIKSCYLCTRRFHFTFSLQRNLEDGNVLRYHAINKIAF